MDFVLQRINTDYEKVFYEIIVSKFEGDIMALILNTFDLIAITNGSLQMVR
jgi:hypothetical protein